MASFDDFKNKWLTNPPSKVADPLLAGDHPYQCVSFVKQGLKEIDGVDTTSSWWGNAIDYWRKTNPTILTHRSRIATQDVEKGDIVILRTAHYNGDPVNDPGEGHTGWATGNVNSSQFELLEQNGQTGNGLGEGGDAIRVRWVDKSRIAGVLRFIPVAQPVASPAPKYQLTETYPQGRQIRLNKQPTNLWGMNYDFDIMSRNPVEVHNAGEVWTVTTKVHHIDGYDYYRRDGQIDGFNVADCDDYTPPAPPVAPQVINTPNVPVPKVEQYPVITKLMVFDTAEDAKGRRNYTGTDIEPDTYIVIQKDEQAYLLSKNNRTDIGWVNTYDNKPPAPEPVQPTLPVDAPATDETLPVDLGPAILSPVEPPVSLPKLQFEMINPIMLSAAITAPKTYTDLENPKNPNVIELTPGKAVEYSMKAWNGSEYFYVPTFCMKKGWRHGIPEADLALPTSTHRPNRMDVNRDGKVNLFDISDGIQDFIWTPLKRTYQQYATPETLKPLVDKSKQFIDGYRRKGQK